jgi:two-component system chemotaxis response regulator CheB
LPKARALLRLDRNRAARSVPVRQTPVTPSRSDLPKRIDLVVVGSSTGGPNALAEVCTHLPPGLEVPIVVVQHMPPVFTRMLADRLATRSGRDVREAVDGETPPAGSVRIAPGDHHVLIERKLGSYRLRLSQDAPENFCRPAVDPLFRSAAATLGGSVLAVVLTGMGRDGTNGAEAIRRAGGYVIGQDEATSVVWGMPGSLAEFGLANELLPLPRIAGEIARWCDRGRLPGALPKANPSRGGQT